MAKTSSVHSNRFVRVFKGLFISGPALISENTPHDVSVNFNTEGFRDDWRDVGIPKPWIPAFELDDSVDEFLRWTFRPGFASDVR